MGIGPGDPQLITLKAASILKETESIFVPRAQTKEESKAKEIAAHLISPEAKVVELVFPMVKDPDLLMKAWKGSIEKISEELRQGKNVAYLTLGDPFLYSTYIYVIKGLKEVLPEVEIETIPGITSFSAAAALAGFPLAEGDEKVAIVSVSDDISCLRKILEEFETVVLMKVAKKLQEIIHLLEEMNLLEGAVLVSRVGLKGERIEYDLRRLKGQSEKEGYLSIILVMGKIQ